MNNFKFSKIIFIIFLLAGAVHCMSGPKKPKKINAYDPFWSPQDTQKALEFAKFWELPEAEWEKTQTLLEKSCKIDNAKEIRDGSYPVYYTGDFQNPRGAICRWNFRKELIHYGEYDQKGKLRGFNVSIFKEKPKTARRYFPQKNMIVRRTWEIFVQGSGWGSALILLEFIDLKANRTVSYLFNRFNNLVYVRHEAYTDNPKKLVGLQYKSITESGLPSCKKIDKRGKATILSGKCPIEFPIFEGGNLLVK